MKRKYILAVISMSIFCSMANAAQGMSVWSAPGEVQNPDYVPRIPKAQREKEAVKKAEEEQKKEETQTVVQKETPKAEKKPEPKAEVKNDEYTRSVGNLNISKDDFEADKKAIMAIISELDAIMKNKAYNKWLNYIDDESKTYLSNPATLKKAQARMPVKGLQLRTLEDYFKYVFIPARQKSKFSEIRYESSTYVKAVEVQEDYNLVYYDFKKINNKWKVHITPLE